MGFKSDGVKWTWEDSSTTPINDIKVKPIIYYTAPELNKNTEPQVITYGWICPKCGRANAPWVSSCPCATPPMKITC